MKRNLAKIIAVVMTAAMLAACGNGGTANNNNDTQTPGPTDTNNNVTEGTGEGDGNQDRYDVFGRPLFDELGRPATAGFAETPMDLRGRNIHIVTTANYFLFNYWLVVDETPNETLAVMAKMRDIMEDYNIGDFTFEVAPAQAGLHSVLLLNRMAGDSPIDLVNMGLTHTNKVPFIQQDLYMDLTHPSISGIMGLDTQPWAEAGKLTTMGGRQYGVHFLMANSGELLRSVFTFNRTYMETFNLGNFYDMVFNRTWTWDAFETICINLVQASGGTVTPIAMRRESEITPNFMKANGGYAVRQTPTGFEFVGDTNDAFLEALDFLVRLSQNGFIVTDVDRAWHRAAAGEFMFLPGLYEPLRQFTRQEIQTEFNWGLLPTPIGPRMDDFVSAQFAADMWFIVNEIDRPEEIAAVLVALANRLSKINIIETELNYGLQDEESAIIMEMLLERIVVDYSRAAGGARNRQTDAVNAALNGSMTPVQALQQFGPQIQQSLDEARLLERD